MKHNKNLGENRKESQLPIKSRGCNEIQGFRGNCDSKGKLGMCPSLAESDSGGIPRRELLLEKPVFPVRQKGVPPLLLPTSMLQLPRCLVRICNLFLTNHKIADLTVSKNAIAAGKTDCKIEFAPQMWATRPHLANIFEKLLDQKTFVCLRLVIENTSLRENGLSHPAKGGSTPAFACQRAAIAPLPCLNLQPSSLSFNFVRIGKFQKMQLQQGKQVAKFNLLRKCGLLAHTSAAFL